MCLVVEGTWSVVNTIVSWLWQCQQEHDLAATQTVSNISTTFYCLIALNIKDFFSYRGNDGWKAILHDCKYCSRTYQQAVGEWRYIWPNLQRHEKIKILFNLPSLWDDFSLLYFISALIVIVGFFLKCLFSGVEEMMSQQDVNCCCSDLFFLEMLVVPPCRYLHSAKIQDHTNWYVPVYVSVVHTFKDKLYLLQSYQEQRTVKCLFFFFLLVPISSTNKKEYPHITTQEIATLSRWYTKYTRCGTII